MQIVQSPWEGLERADDQGGLIGGQGASQLVVAFLKQEG